MAGGRALYLKVSLCKPVGAAVPVECRRVFRNVCHFQRSETPFATSATNHIYKKARSKCENGPHRSLFSSPVELRLLLPRYTTAQLERRNGAKLPLLDIISEAHMQIGTAHINQFYARLAETPILLVSLNILWKFLSTAKT